jgi:hypothetical protein
MLFAAIDFFAYKRRSGRFSREHGTDLMCGAFESELPAGLVAHLEAGDLLLVGFFGWWASWLIMYLTSSQISHVAIYAGEGRIIDATLGGSQLSSIKSLFAPGTRIVACRVPIPSERRPSPQSFSNYVGIPYGFQHVYRKALRILLGRDWPYFRWRFFVDTSLLFVVADLPFLILLRTPVFSWLVVLYLALIAFHAWLWPRRPFNPDAAHGKPADAVPWMLSVGARFLLDPHSPFFRRYNSPDA